MHPVRTIAAFAHRHVWQSIPRNARRQALVRLSAALAPRLGPAPKASEPIIVAGFLTAATGLGAAARLGYEALRQSGRRVLGIDLTQAFRQGVSGIDFAFEDGRNHMGPGTLLVHVNAPLMPLALWRIGAGVVAEKLVVGCWAWELPVAPDEWRAGLPFVHRIVAPSTFTRDAIRAIADGLPVDVATLPVIRPSQGSSTVTQALRTRDPGAPFAGLVVFNMASGFTRKNPLAAIEAFRLAFPVPGEARLLVKLLNAKTYPAGADRLRALARDTPNVVLDERNLSPSALWDLYLAADVVLSLHRSEGFGLVIAEAMLAGRPVLATDWSGNTDFLSQATGVPIPYRLVPATDPQGECQHPNLSWAEADVVTAAAQLMRLRADPAWCEKLGQTARGDAEQRFSVAAYAQRLEQILALDARSASGA